MAISTASSTGRVSFKQCMVVCDSISAKRVSDAKAFLSRVLDGKDSIGGRQYTQTTKKILEVLTAAEANAKQKNLDTEKMFVKTVKADRANKFILAKSRAKFRGREAKLTNLKIVLEER